MEVLGMFNYYRSFIKWFAWIAAPLYDGLKKPSDIADESKFDLKSRVRMYGRRTFPDTPETRKAFELLKRALASAPVLIHPDFAREKTMKIEDPRRIVHRNLLFTFGSLVLSFHFPFHFFRFPLSF